MRAMSSFKSSLPVVALERRNTQVHVSLNNDDNDGGGGDDNDDYDDSSDDDDDECTSCTGRRTSHCTIRRIYQTIIKENITYYDHKNGATILIEEL